MLASKMFQKVTLTTREHQLQVFQQMKLSDLRDLTQLNFCCMLEKIVLTCLKIFRLFIG